MIWVYSLPSSCTPPAGVHFAHVAHADDAHALAVDHYDCTARCCARVKLRSSAHGWALEGDGTWIPIVALLNLELKFVKVPTAADAKPRLAWAGPSLSAHKRNLPTKSLTCLIVTSRITPVTTYRQSSCLPRRRSSEVPRRTSRLERRTVAR